MNLHGDLPDSKFSPDLFVHHAHSHEKHHLPLAVAERIEATMQIVLALLAVSSAAIAVERNSNSVQKFLLAKRLGKEFNRASLHSLYRHRNVSVAQSFFHGRSSAM